MPWLQEKRSTSEIARKLSWDLPPGHRVSLKFCGNIDYKVTFVSRRNGDCPFGKRKIECSGEGGDSVRMEVQFIVAGLSMKRLGKQGLSASHSGISGLGEGGAPCYCLKPSFLGGKTMGSSAGFKPTTLLLLQGGSGLPTKPNIWPSPRYHLPHLPLILFFSTWGLGGYDCVRNMQWRMWESNLPPHPMAWRCALPTKPFV